MIKEEESPEHEEAKKNVAIADVDRKKSDLDDDSIDRGGRGVEIYSGKCPCCGRDARVTVTIEHE